MRGCGDRPWKKFGGLLLLLGGAREVFGEAPSCIDGNVASAPPAALWGELVPGVAGRIPAARDSTDYTGHELPDSLYPNFSSLDVENGWVFVSYSLGVQVWDARGTKAADPRLVGERDAKRCGDFLEPPFACGSNGTGEARWSVWDIDAPAGKDDVVAAFGRAPLGVTIWDTTVKSSLEPKYQDTGANFGSGWAATIGGRDYAFAAGDGTRGLDGVSVYDLTAAKALAEPCFEDSSVSTGCGVRRSRFSTGAGALYLDGFQRADGRTYLVHSGGSLARGFELWQILGPTEAVNLRSGGGRFAAERLVLGVALWEQAGRDYLAAWMFEEAANQYVARIYDVTACLVANGCAELGAPVRTLHRLTPLSTEYLVTFSRGTGGTPYLYFGHDAKCLSGRQQEWLYDVTALATGGELHEVTPDGTITAQTATEGPVQVDYWSYAYATNPGGFSQVMPRVGKFSGDWFYRAAWTLFDTHRRMVPQIALSGPASGGTGQNLRFEAAPTNCTPGATGWLWSASGGAVGGGSGAVGTFRWPAAGSYTVTARHPACPTAEGVRTVTVVPPGGLPLAAAFVADACTASGCSFLAGAPVGFTDLSAGVVPSTQYFYDWQHTGSNAATCRFAFGSAQPETSHLFAAPGSFTPCLKVTRANGEEHVFVHTPPISIGGTPVPLVALSGPSASRPGQIVTLAARAEGCAPGAAGWLWSVPGGQVVGAADGASLRVSFPTAGSRSVTVAHPACPAALASRTIAVSGPPGLGAVTAEFHYQASGAGTLELDGSPSTGAGDFTWHLPGGVEKTGAQILHRFPAAGTYPVTLEVRATGCPAASCPVATVTRNVRVE